ncbi:hypothetical protein [Acidithiobacillus caldus]
MSLMRAIPLCNRDNPNWRLPPLRWDWSLRCCRFAAVTPRTMRNYRDEFLSAMKRSRAAKQVGKTLCPTGQSFALLPLVVFLLALLSV